MRACRGDNGAGVGAAGQNRSGHWAVSSPRVLSDLFWMPPRRARVENMARLIVTRERYSRFPAPAVTPMKASAPVLMAALGKITGWRHRNWRRRMTGRHDAVAPSTLCL